jgi:DNA-binding PadR family transcriptional regulator
MTDAELSRYLPLNPRVFAILAVLLEAPAHGYRIKQSVEERSEGAVTLDPGSLYRTIAKLLDEGVLEEVPAPAEAGESDPRRRYYGVTALGRALAAAEASRLRHLLAQPGLHAGWAGGERSE